ncbi:DNA translocase FtsK 4TM domain-containing protein [Kordia sp. YSTF-M3]|uniref:DNA translocase FtsK 4TM domain-containing protein n=1 Tax=Kordia aestuariivivens TaxID=2759037 RepID=A0ABR7QF55_9FLAO|nr:DNA translocase FtsK [Kordia aestuariivivens]MBC8757205.1 DNA translocase FtsK 4TM domain-containing protein [Kordia aestuariivivens]
MAKKKPVKKTSKTPRVPKFKKPDFTLTRQHKIVLGSLLMLFAIALFIAFISFFFTWKMDQSELGQLDRISETQNWMQKFGANISHFFIYKGFGIASIIFSVLLFRSGLNLFLSSQKKLFNNWFWGCIIVIWVSIFSGFFFSSLPLLGGTIGYEINSFLQDYIGGIGIGLLLLFGAITYAVVRLKLTPENVTEYFKKKSEAIKEDFATDETIPEPTLNVDETTATTTPENATIEEATGKKTEVEKSDFELSIENLQPTIKNHSDREKEATKPQKLDTSFEVEIPPEEETEIEVEKILEEKTVTENLSDKLVKEHGEFDPKLELGNFRFPTIELLKDYTNGSSITINQEELEENKNQIVTTLRNYKIEIASIKATVGPTVTLYEIIPEAGVRISKIKNLEDDIALSLAALGIRIIAPMPGKGTIGIEVPNKKPAIVSMRSAIASKKFQEAEMQLPIAFGKTISNETLVVDLAKMPHLLMAGATGQGKSVGLNCILTSLLYKKHPAEVKFVLVDPKKVELTLFNKIERHYLAKLPDSEEAIITDNSKVINTLNSLCIEMDNRYDMLKNALCRNIVEYNAKFKARKLNPNDGHKFLPYIVLVVDEFADLIMTAGKEVETPIARLAQLARAIGIHLIIATQRPSVNVITGMIKANFPARVAFRVMSKIDSRTILDNSGADQLIGRGDMLYTQGNDLIRIQCAFVDTPEVEKITDFIGAQKAYPDAHILPEYVGEESGISLDIDISDRDKLFRQAAEVIVIAQQGSASLLQRKLKLGYNRAGRIIDQLEAAGIVGQFEGSKARQVLVPDILALEQLLENEKNE